MTPQDLRAEIARRQAVVYQLAAQIGLHPGRLGQMLNERLPMPPDVAERLMDALGMDRGVPVA
jgi:plasmid maintenance system antidote protein VapI